MHLHSLDVRAPTTVRKLCTLGSFLRTLNTDSSSAPSVKKLASREIDDGEKGKQMLELPLITDPPRDEVSLKREVLVRERKQKWTYKHTSCDRFDKLLNMCATKLGTTAAVYVFDHLGKETGLKEYNALIKLCIKMARETSGEYVATEEVSNAFHVFKIMTERGFQLEEQTYRPVLQYIIDMGLVQEFQRFSDVIKADNPRSISRLGYYEMMLWIRVNNEEMIRNICEYITVEDSKDTSALRESYLLALCESDRKTQILDVLKNIDIIKLRSAESISHIFRSLGRLLLESDAENLRLEEYNTLIKVCIKKARETSDEYVAIEEMSKAFHLFRLMRECGFQLEEQTYRPVLLYIIDMGLVQEFQLFSDVIKADNPRSISRLGYYEMMLWKRVNNEDK